MKFGPDWMSEEAQLIIKKGMLKSGEKTAFDLYDRVAKKVAEYAGPLIGQDVRYVLARGWLGLATPVASNFGSVEGGLPVSCFGSHLGDSIPSIYDHLKELAVMSQNGGGLGAYFGDIRPGGSPISRGGTSSSVLNWMLQFDSMAAKVSQGSSRRGAIAVYLPIDHPDVTTVLNSKKMLDGDHRQKLDCNVGLMVTDKFMESVLSGDPESRKLFSLILQLRDESGSPYLVFKDTINSNRPQAYVNNGLYVSTSQLCSEITLYTDENTSFSCVLSSLNLARYFEWSNWHGVSKLSLPALAIVLLDAVVEDFIQRSKEIDDRHKDNSFQRAREGTIKGRPLGLGVMGLGRLFQSMLIPFDSPEARELNKEIFKFIKQEAVLASQMLAQKFGEPEWCQGTGMRNTHLLANAPTMTNSVITGAESPGVEPMAYNYFTVSGEKSNFFRYNRCLYDYCVQTGREGVWEKIKTQPNGSIQNLDEFTDYEKLVFRTAFEIPQTSLIEMQADREPYICQATSFNLFNDPGTPAHELAKQIILAWKKGVKSLYYNRSSSRLAKMGSDAGIFEHLVSNSGWLIKTRKGCKWCGLAKAFLIAHNIPFKEEPADEFGSVPQVFHNGKFLGGYEQLLSHFGEKVEPTKGLKIESDCQACEG